MKDDTVLIEFTQRLVDYCYEQYFTLICSDEIAK